MATRTTQQAAVLNWLQSHGGLTVREAVTELGVMSLPKRIEELRRSGHCITTTYRKTNSGARYGVYQLNGGADV